MSLVTHLKAAASNMRFIVINGRQVGSLAERFKEKDPQKNPSAVSE